MRTYLLDLRDQLFSKLYSSNTYRSSANKAPFFYYKEQGCSEYPDQLLTAVMYNDYGLTGSPIFVYVKSNQKQYDGWYLVFLDDNRFNAFCLFAKAIKSEDGALINMFFERNGIIDKVVADSYVYDSAEELESLGLMYVKTVYDKGHYYCYQTKYGDHHTERCSLSKAIDELKEQFADKSSMADEMSDAEAEFYMHNDTKPTDDNKLSDEEVTALNDCYNKAADDELGLEHVDEHTHFVRFHFQPGEAGTDTIKKVVSHLVDGFNCVDPYVLVVRRVNGGCLITMEQK